MRRTGQATRRDILGFAAALAGPILATLALLPLGGVSRDYVFIYLAIVAVLAVVSGLGPALLAAMAGFLLVDYFFVPPIHTLTFADQTDLINLIVFFSVAGLVGGLGSRRRPTQLQAEALSLQLRRAHAALGRRTREQAGAGGR